eukprot:2933790-Amphidinium_carterae.1
MPNNVASNSREDMLRYGAPPTWAHGAESQSSTTKNQRASLVSPLEVKLSQPPRTILSTSAFAS